MSLLCRGITIPNVGSYGNGRTTMNLGQNAEIAAFLLIAVTMSGNVRIIPQPGEEKLEGGYPTPSK